MTMPMSTVTDNNGHRKYVWPNTGEIFDSVTTAIANGMPKPALQFWSAKVVATHAVQHIDDIAEDIAKKGEKRVIEALRGRPQIESSAKAHIGDLVHAAVEDYIRYERRPLTRNPKVETALDYFENFIEDWHPSFLHTEVTIYNRRHGYAGTADQIVSIDGMPMVIDVKSGNGVWPEAAIQMAAYKNGDFIGHYGKELKLPKIEAAAVLHLSPDDESYGFVPVYVGDEVFEQFIRALETYRFTYQTAPQIKVVYRHITPVSAQRMNGKSPEWVKKLYKKKK